MSDYTPKPTDLKRCKTCGAEYPPTKQYFPNHSGTRLRPHCRKCWPIVKANNAIERSLIPNGQKKCSKCEQLFPATSEYFAVNKSLSTGIGSVCKTCTYKRCTDWRAKLTPDQRTAIYRRRIGYFQRYTARPEYPLQKHTYYLKVSKTPRFKAKRREYAKTEAFRRSAVTKEARRRARKSNLVSDFTASDWERCLDYFDCRCAVCGNQAGLWTILAQDHWIPIAKGGGSTRTNIVPLCHSRKDGEGGCNNSKSYRMPLEWLADRFGKRKAKAIMQRIDDYFATLI